jgi:hypothetical protein
VAVITLAEAKTELNITSSTSDAELTSYLARAEGVLENHCGRSFSSVTRTDTFDVYKHERFYTLRPPVTAITSVTLDVTALAATAYDYNGTSGVLEILVSPGYSLTGGLVVVYTTGYATAPDALKHAVLMQVRHMWETQRTTPGARRDDEWNPAQGYMIPNRVAEALRPYMVLGSAS